MSAFILSDTHINLLLTWANRNIRPYTIPVDNGLEELSFGKVDDIQKMAEILRKENVRSVNCRYNETTDPEELKITFHYQSDVTIVEIIKACHCYDYQACETDDYPTTDAHRIIDWILDAAIHLLPGYEQAKWDWD